MRAFAVLLWIALPVLAAPVPKEVKKTDIDRFEGIWWETSYDGAAPTRDPARRFHFDRDGSAGIQTKAGAAPYQYNYAFERATSPPAFTWNSKTGEKYIAIYRLEKDALFIIFKAAGETLPTEVKPGDGFELKRVK